METSCLVFYLTNWKKVFPALPSQCLNSRLGPFWIMASKLPRSPRIPPCWVLWYILSFFLLPTIIRSSNTHVRFILWARPVNMAEKTLISVLPAWLFLFSVLSAGAVVFLTQREGRKKPIFWQSAVKLVALLQKIPCSCPSYRSFVNRSQLDKE